MCLTGTGYVRPSPPGNAPRPRNVTAGLPTQDYQRGPATNSAAPPHLSRRRRRRQSDGHFFIAMELCEGGTLADLLAARGARQEHLALRVGHAAARAQAVAARDDRSDAHPAARQFLRHQAVFEGAEAEAAVFLRDGDAEEAEVAHLVDQLARDVALLRVEPVGDGGDLIAGEGARQVLHHQALFGHIGRGQRLGFAGHGLRPSRFVECFQAPAAGSR